MYHLWKVSEVLGATGELLPTPWAPESTCCQQLILFRKLCQVCKIQKYLPISPRFANNQEISPNQSQVCKKSRNTFQSVSDLQNQEISSNQSQSISNVCLHGCPEWSLCHWGLCVCNSGQEDGDIAAPG